MSWFKTFYKEPSLYWPPPKRDGKGFYVWNYPDELFCRWASVNKQTVFDEAGATVMASSIVYTFSSVLIESGGYLIKGGLYDFDSLVPPPIEEEADPDAISWDRQTYARQIVSISKETSIYNPEVVMSKVFLR